ADGATANASTGDYQLICAPEGWSGISGYKVPENPAIEDVLSGIANEMGILLSNSGFYWPSQNINTIGNWDPNNGYKIKMNEPACFVMIGDMSEDKTIIVNTGANYIPVLCDQAVPAVEIFSQFGNDMMFAFDLQTQKIYWPEGGIYTLEVLAPGVGYLVSMYQPGEATFLCENKTLMNDVKAQKQVFENEPWVYTVSGTQHLISINKSAFADMGKGDFIGVFNNYGLCAGYTQYNGETENLLLVAYSDDFTSDAIDGLQESENMTFRIFRPSQMLETEVAVQFDASMPNTGSFADMGQSMILKLGEGATTIQENGRSNISIYPNPATDIVYISLNGVDYTEATVVIYDTEGRAIINQVFNGQAELNVSSLKAGIYFVKINTETMNEIMKLVIK
nr:T9SS type A sorting domain-containing protein [Bacteroidota bacterium]